MEEYSPSDHSVCLGDDHINSCQRRGVAKELWHRSWLAFDESSSSEESKQSESILLCLSSDTYEHFNVNKIVGSTYIGFTT